VTKSKINQTKDFNLSGHEYLVKKVSLIALAQLLAEGQISPTFLAPKHSSFWHMLFW
jgi:hypothetical protein